MIKVIAKRKPENRRSMPESGAGNSTSGSASSAEFAEKLANARSLQEIFELVKETAWKTLRVDQAGLMVGLAELGISSHGVLGAYYSPEGNTIVMNKTVMNQLKGRASMELYNSYCFYILLHEYLHSCGFYDEAENRQIVAAIASQTFGHDHPVAKLAETPNAMLGLLGNAQPQAPDQFGNVEFVEGIDRGNTNYIS
ncbi:hypothetical protein HYV83_06025 [Candidatus Woesearchaeota archaeon]|nr:hypothetical protein [Candidatus Woesearchaeota archaeon]